MAPGILSLPVPKTLWQPLLGFLGLWWSWLVTCLQTDLDGWERKGKENYLFKTAFQTPPGLRLCPCVPSPAQSTCGQAAAAWHPHPPSAPHRGIHPWPAGHGHQKRREKGKEAVHVCIRFIQAGLKTQKRDEKLHQLTNCSLQFLFCLLFVLLKTLW